MMAACNRTVGMEAMSLIYLLVAGIIALVLVVLVMALVVPRIRSRRRRRLLEPVLAQYRAGQALVRYVMLNRQCSEEVAYRRIATFVKKHVPLDDHSYIESMLAHDRQLLIEKAQEILVQDSNAIDKI